MGQPKITPTIVTTKAPVGAPDDPGSTLSVRLLPGSMPNALEARTPAPLMRYSPLAGSALSHGEVQTTTHFDPSSCSRSTALGESMCTTSSVLVAEGGAASADAVADHPSADANAADDNTASAIRRRMTRNADPPATLV